MFCDGCRVRDGGRPVLGGEVAKHVQEPDIAALRHVLADLLEQAVRASRPARGHGRIAAGGKHHAHPEGAARGLRQFGTIDVGLEGLLDRRDAFVVLAQQEGCRGQAVQVVGAERLGVDVGPGLERGGPFAALEGLPRLPQVFDQAHAVHLLLGGYGDASPLVSRQALRAFLTPATGWSPATYDGPVDDPGGDVAGVAADTGQDHRAEPELERQPAEEESGCVLHHPAVLGRPAVLTEDRQIDPVEDLTKAGRPHHVRHVVRRAVDDGTPVLDAGHPCGDPLDATRLEVGLLDPDHRPAMEADVLHLLAADGRTPGDDVAPGEDQHREDEPHLPGLDAWGDLAAVATGQDRRVGLRHLVGDVGARV